MAAGSSEANIVEKAVDEALKELQRRAPDEFKELIASDPKRKEELVAAAREAAEEEVKHSKDVRADFSSSDVESHLRKHLPAARVEAIKSGLTIPTYQMRLNKRPDGHVWADITRDGKEFMPSIKLDTLSGMDAASWMQAASIIVEGVLLVLSAVGIKLSVDDYVIKKIAEQIGGYVESSSVLQEAVREVKDAFAGGSTYEEAKAIFHLIKESESADILWKIIKGLCSEMSAWEWMKTAGIVTATIIAAVATDGTALIAKIVLSLNSAVEFIKKLDNLRELDALRSAHQSRTQA